jgi:hypothetical protein
MAIEWHVRIGRPFTLRQASLTAAGVVGELLRVDGDDLTIEAEGTEATLSQVWEPVVADPRESVHAIFRIPAWEAACRISLTEVIPWEEDDDGSGLIAGVQSARDDPSQILSVATVCALAQLGGGPVLDDSLRLGGAYERDPSEIIAHLRLDAPAESLRAAMSAVLSKTELRQYG